MINFKQCANYLIEKEGVRHLYDDDRSHYRNDKIELSTTIGDEDYSSVVINFLNEKSCDRKNEVRIIVNRKNKNASFVFSFNDNTKLRIDIDSDSKITFFTLNGNFVDLTRMSARKFYWFEQDPSRRARINLDDYNAIDVVEKIRRTIIGDKREFKDNDEKLKEEAKIAIFDRFFEIIRPILVLSILEVNIYTVATIMYDDLKCVKGKIGILEKNLASKDLNEKTRALIEKQELDNEVREIKDLIDITQCSIYDEYEPFIQKEKVR